MAEVQQMWTYADTLGEHLSAMTVGASQRDRILATSAGEIAGLALPGGPALVAATLTSNFAEEYEKNNDKEALESSYKVINQIFTYIISELGWSISQNTNDWDDTPLKIMSEVFPKIETTKWFKDQQLSVAKSISTGSYFN